MKDTSRKRIDRLFETEVEPWRQAWGQFWDQAWTPLSDHELDLILDFDDGTLADEAERRLLEKCEALSIFVEGEPWSQWQEAIDEALCEARPSGTLPMDRDASITDLRRPALARWPRGLPSPPAEPEGLWACLKAVTSQAEREGVLTAQGHVAACWLYYLARAQAVCKVRR